MDQNSNKQETNTSDLNACTHPDENIPIPFDDIETLSSDQNFHSLPIYPDQSEQNVINTSQTPQKQLSLSEEYIEKDVLNHPIVDNDIVKDQQNGQQFLENFEKSPYSSRNAQNLDYEESSSNNILSSPNSIAFSSDHFQMNQQSHQIDEDRMYEKPSASTQPSDLDDNNQEQNKYHKLTTDEKKYIWDCVRKNFLNEDQMRKIFLKDIKDKIYPDSKPQQYLSSVNYWKTRMEKSFQQDPTRSFEKFMDLHKDHHFEKQKQEKYINKEEQKKERDGEKLQLVRYLFGQGIRIFPYQKKKYNKAEKNKDFYKYSKKFLNGRQYLQKWYTDKRREKNTRDKNCNYMIQEVYDEQFLRFAPLKFEKGLKQNPDFSFLVAPISMANEENRQYLSSPSRSPSSQ